MINWKSIERLALAHHKEDRSSNEDSLRRFLELWWCRTYNRPFKDPVLKDYTLDDLIYEFLRLRYLDPDNDPQKKDDEKQAQAEDDAWIKSQLEKTTKEVRKKKRRAKKASISDMPDLSTKFE